MRKYGYSLFSNVALLISEAPSVKKLSVEVIGRSRDPVFPNPTSALW